MAPWRDWYHVNGNTYGTWLPGDPRGWRSRHHKEHVEGDYTSPPPPGTYDALHAAARDAMKRPPVRLTRPQRRVAAGTIAAALRDLAVQVLAVSVDAIHYHVLGRFVGVDVRRTVGRAKKIASDRLGEAGLKGVVWARGCRPLPIQDRQHQINVYGYVRKHVLKGACVWTFRDGIIEPTG